LTGIKKTAAADTDRSVPLDIQRRFVISAFAGTAAWWLENGMPYPPELMAESMIKIIQKN